MKSYLLVIQSQQDSHSVHDLLDSESQQTEDKVQLGTKHASGGANLAAFDIDLLQPRVAILKQKRG